MNSKILLTGANGMVGKNILEHPCTNNYQILAPSSNELNLLDNGQVREYLITHCPDIIIHAAGIVGGVQANISNPVKFLVDNMQIGLNIILSARDAGIKKFINLGSSCMYPRDATNPLTEDLVLKGELEPTNEGYALAKVTSTRLCEYIHRESPDFLYKTLIPCNLYGKFDKFDPLHSHMIPAVIKKITDAKSNGVNIIEIWGDGTARREFMYAGDFADFIFYAIDHYEDIPQNLNVGLGHDYSINEYYEIIAKIVGFKGVFEYDLSKPVGMKQKLIDDSKLNTLGWKHSSSLEDGVRKTYEYYIGEIANV
ncbi:GDP-L-fucose synthetase [hydrothermal vent metagenome]|uniref:GDP-L-fucose synthetase n=1 Tax=hydrothermal vent metagenome TaxID=652676 RepID=A0A3B0YBJ3_9ZZZZ